LEITTAADYTNSSNTLIVGESAPTAEQCVTGPTTGANVVFNFAGGWTNVAGLTITGTGTPACATDTTTNCRPYRVYLSTSSGAEQLQTTGGSCGVSGATANSCYPGGSFSLPYSSIATGTSSPPTSGAAGFAIHESHPFQTGTGWVGIAQQQADSTCFWEAGTTAVTCCPAISSGAYTCGGHSTHGVKTFLNDTDASGENWAQQSRSPATPLTFSQVNSPTPPAPDSDTHISWNNANGGSDLEPSLVTHFEGAAATGNGSTNLNTNPCSLASGASSFGGYMDEMDLFAHNGFGKVWRVAQTRGAGGCANPFATVGSGAGYVFGDIAFGHISPDGRFALFSSPWGWQLGNDPSSLQGVSGYPSSGWSTLGAGHAYSANQCIWDGANFECTTAGGTAGSSQPTWPTTSGQTTTDGSVTWQMVTGCTDSHNQVAWIRCRNDIFLVELK
jgi:hypothetical protein